MEEIGVYDDNPKLKELQHIELDLLRNVINICLENNISYYLAFGTLLGAVRHKGFIPWDDDLDIFMTRENLQRFLAIPKEKIPKNIHIRTYQNTPNDNGDITIQTKIEYTKKKVIRLVGDNQIVQNIWIDVFVIDGMPDKALARRIHYFNIIFHQTLYRVARSYRNGTLKNKKRNSIEKIGIALLKLIPVGRFLDARKQMKKTEKVFAKYKVEQSKWVIAYAPEYGYRCVVPSTAFGKGVVGEFEKIKVILPSNYDLIMRSWYGDYMNPPPKEEQKSKHCVDII